MNHKIHNKNTVGVEINTGFVECLLPWYYISSCRCYYPKISILSPSASVPAMCPNT